MNELDNIFTEIAIEAQNEPVDLVDDAYQAPYKHWIDTGYYTVDFSACIFFLKKVFKAIPDVRFTDDFKYHPLLDENFIKNPEYTLIFDFKRPSYILVKRVYEIIKYASQKYSVYHILRIDGKHIKSNKGSDIKSLFIMSCYDEMMLKNNSDDPTYHGSYHWYDLHRRVSHEREIIYGRLEEKCKINILKHINGCILENVPMNNVVNEMEELNGIFDEYAIPDVVMARRRIEGIQGVRFDIYYMNIKALRSHSFSHDGFVFPDKFIIGKSEAYRIVDGRIVIVCSFDNHQPEQRAFVTITFSFRKRQFNWESINKALNIIFRQDINRTVEFENKLEILKKSLCPLEYSNHRNKLMRFYAQ